MKIDAGLMGSLAEAPERARELEAQGFDLIRLRLTRQPPAP